MTSLLGRVAVVTGAASGIGQATAQTMAARGAHVVVADLNLEAADDVARDIVQTGGVAAAFRFDAARESSIADLIAFASDKFGRLDILHNNVAHNGISVISRDNVITDVDAKLFAEILNVNVIGYMLGAKYAIPKMIEGGGGVIINTSSIAGLAAELVRPMYATSKAAILGMTRSIATQYGRRGIRCVSISPGVIVRSRPVDANSANPNISSYLQPNITTHENVHSLVGRDGRPADVGAVVAFLASDDASLITGTDIVVDGGVLAHFPDYAAGIAAGFSPD